MQKRLLLFIVFLNLLSVLSFAEQRLRVKTEQVATASTTATQVSIPDNGWLTLKFQVIVDLLRK